MCCCSDGWLLFPSDSKSALSPRPTGGGASILTLVLFDASPKVTPTQASTQALRCAALKQALTTIPLVCTQVRGGAAIALGSILEHSPIAKMLSLAPVLASASSPAGLTSARATRHSRTFPLPCASFSLLADLIRFGSCVGGC